MTVEQLIEALRKLPPHHVVLAYQRSMEADEDLAGQVEDARPAGHGFVVLEAE